ncbi:uncharacterized protein THITE_2119556 [Thermothielavioides terrestris NRRL 8126]|uniref:Transcription factor domain-containing protein n=1 Tax=Thermothielavioides terrestris (strain ATCC 38088 / NRRL 8126) TaxID=578455 RepID=G2RBY3_THETT|nr:uncharacterized protein THITE_2119556 [Thermothielavioides terrestris NRRL 8126]AEO69304.1 hypothetical protein THITE_2119556 [Thermothielavioides terrestris NRRL 8126]
MRQGEECHRLRKPCMSQTPAPPRKRKEPKPTRVAELERRLEDLKARIESVQRLGLTVPSPPYSDHHGGPPHPLGPPEVDPPPPRNLSGTRVPIPTFGRDRWESPFGHLFPDESIFEVQPGHPEAAAAAATNGRPGHAPEAAAHPAPPGLAPPAQTRSAGSTPSSPPPLQRHEDTLWPSGEEAEALLNECRRHMGHLFPFVVVPRHLSSAQMREQRPFLWKGVMLQMFFFDGKRQTALGHELLKDVLEAAFVRPQKTLDLLQGLQLLVACYHYNLSSFQMINLLFLARSIATSLGCAELKSLPNDGGYTSECLEQMRAFAGTYYLVTITFTTNKRPDALMNTSYLAACCRALLKQMEYPTDELVVHLVRAQQLSQSISQGFAQRKASPTGDQPPQPSFIQSLRERIQAFRAALPPHIKTNLSLAGHFHVAEIIIYESSVPELSQYPLKRRQRRPSAPTTTTNTATTTPDSAAVGAPAPVPAADAVDPERIDLLWACVRAVRAFMENRFANRMGDYPRFVYLTSFELTYVFLTMLKLVTLQVPGWDLARVREEVGFDDFVSRLVEDMECMAERRKRGCRIGGGELSGQGPAGSNHSGMAGQVSGAYDGHGHGDWPEDPWANVARKVRNVKDNLLINGFDNEYSSSQVARVCDPVPMTLADATQDLMQDLGGSLWDHVPLAGTWEWTPYFMGDTMDWSAVFSGYGGIS